MTKPRHEPWRYSTGPKTPEGKARSAQRWRTHGLRSAEHAAIRRWLRSIAALVATRQT